MTKLFTKAGISPGSNTVRPKRRTLIVFAFGKKETEKYKKYRKLVKSAQLREEENKKRWRVLHMAQETLHIRAFCRLTIEDRAKSHWTFFVVHFIPDHEFFVRSVLARTVRPLSGL
ncbi:hypothetical protein J6590_088166 [Homalodisca vitripennis]|nr:hypothetical protein J6590_088166 [Homalodisca vitripennis]